MICFINVDVLSTANIGKVGHFHTIGHMASETDIKNSRTDAFVLYYVNDLCHKRSGLPGKGTSGLKDHLQVWPAVMERLHNADK